MRISTRSRNVNYMSLGDIMICIGAKTIGSNAIMSQCVALGFSSTFWRDLFVTFPWSRFCLIPREWLLEYFQKPIVPSHNYKVQFQPYLPQPLTGVQLAGAQRGKQRAKKTNKSTSRGSAVFRAQPHLTERLKEVISLVACTLFCRLAGQMTSGS